MGAPTAIGGPTTASAIVDDLLACLKHHINMIYDIIGFFETSFTFIFQKLLSALSDLEHMHQSSKVSNAPFRQLH